MSYAAVQAVIDASRQPGRFTDAEFRVMVNLAEHHNAKTGRCDPSGRLLSEEADKGQDKRNAVRVLRALEKRGEISRADPSSKGGRGRRQAWRILLNGELETPFGDPKGVMDGIERVSRRRPDQQRSSTTRKEPVPPVGGTGSYGESAAPAARAATPRREAAEPAMSREEFAARVAKAVPPRRTTKGVA